MLTEEEFRLFRDLIYKESGIYLKETRKDFLENRMLKRMGVTAMSSPYWYYRLITEKKKTELLILLDLLTVNETSFFRNKPQIELFGKAVLPDLMRKKSHDARKRLRIWSAGCSTGEEPYTIAMVVHETVPDLSEWDVKIFASDLSLTAIETASRGEYENGKVRASVDEHYITRYFDRIISPASEKKNEGGFGTNGEYYKVKDEVRGMVVFDFHNLKNDNGLGDLDVIFCRNVMIYFDEEEQKRLIEKFYRSLNSGGYLLLGHAESIHGLSTGFEFIYDNKGTAYKKSDKERI